ncbi:hypothetical protein [Sinorhizobium meliloti]|uniref:hypothetical protein n=1 Tax=Rhizobium meliloti TaxID=382 RepID=UPI003D64C9F9
MSSKGKLLILGVSSLAAIAVAQDHAVVPAEAALPAEKNNPPAIHRLHEIRAKYISFEKPQSTAHTQAVQWLNWPNWANFNNFPNW